VHQRVLHGCCVLSANANTCTAMPLPIPLPLPPFHDRDEKRFAKRTMKLTRNRGSRHCAGHRACKCRRRRGRPVKMSDQQMRPAARGSRNTYRRKCSSAQHLPEIRQSHSEPRLGRGCARRHCRGGISRGGVEGVMLCLVVVPLIISEGGSRLLRLSPSINLPRRTSRPDQPNHLVQRIAEQGQRCRLSRP
jgi:hypothetical protein